MFETAQSHFLISFKVGVATWIKTFSIRNGARPIVSLKKEGDNKISGVDYLEGNSR